MAEELTINKNLSDEEQYIQLVPQLSGLVNPGEPVISNLANLTAALKQSFNKISWVGFYMVRDGKLYLGPFQGNTACTVIDFGKGVCGTAAKEMKTIIVEDVDRFPGHIACDAGSRSEIVVPLIQDGILIGVLDVDSYEYASFDETDKVYLEKICKIVSDKLDLREFEIR